MLQVLSGQDASLKHNAVFNSVWILTLWVWQTIHQIKERWHYVQPSTDCACVLTVQDQSLRWVNVPDVIVLNPIMTVCWQNRARVCDGLIYQMILCPALQWLCVDYKDCMWTVWTTMAVCWQTRTRVGDWLIPTVTVCWPQWLCVDCSDWVLTTMQWLGVDRPELESVAC